MDQEPIAAELPSHQQRLQDLPFDVSLLRLDSGKSTATGDNNQPPNTYCRCKCNCSSVKRPSPVPSNERHAKKPNHDSHSLSLCDFSVLPLPPISLPALRRCGSGPYIAPRPSTSRTGDSLVAQSPPDDAKIVADTPLSKVGSFSLLPKHTSLPDSSVPPLPPTATQSFPTLPHCVSDLYTSPRSSTSQTGNSLVAQSPPEAARIVADSPLSKGGSSSRPPKPAVHPTPSPDKTSSRSSGSNEENALIKRWQRMKDRLKEMTEWLEEMREGEEKKVTEDPTKDENEEEEEEEEEAVWVERKGKCLVVHFKCPCGKGYQILLSGGMCYYKLM